MYAGSEILYVASGTIFESEFSDRVEVMVRREGYSRVRQLFITQGKTIGRLRWRGVRRAVYETRESSFDIKLGALNRRITLVGADGGRSVLFERLKPGRDKAELFIRLPEGDVFSLERTRRRNRRSEIVVRSAASPDIALVFDLDSRPRSRMTARVEVRAPHGIQKSLVHRLMALLVCRVIIDRKRTGRLSGRRRVSGARRQTR